MIIIVIIAMNSTVALTLITVITYLFYALVKLIYKNRYHWTRNCLKCINAIPGPKGIFPIGNVLEFSGSEGNALIIKIYMSCEF